MQATRVAAPFRGSVNDSNGAASLIGTIGDPA
jgi:hypothetical protein